MKYVYDTAEITNRRITEISENFIVPRKVISEVRKGFLAKKIESIEDSLEILDPDEGSRAAARRGAEETGDLDSLSETDIDVIAVAIMVAGTVVSDDYSIQNTCIHLGIPVQGSSAGKIRREIKWIWRCTGCRKKFPNPQKSCPVCGHELKRFPASQRDL